MLAVRIEPEFDSWRDEARKLLNAGIPPAEVFWTDENQDQTLPLLAGSSELASVAPGVQKNTVPREFISQARTASYFRDAERWALLYRILFRLVHEQPRLLEIAVDPDVHRLSEMTRAVRRDLHKMHAFVRFRKVKDEEGDHFIAFHRPDHLILRPAAVWFARRFPVMRWTILTPDGSVSWDGAGLQFGAGVSQSPVAGDDVEDLWRTYYASTFNPARIKLKAMKKEMPMRHWKTMPETELIDEMLKEAPARVAEMVARNGGDLQAAKRAAAGATPFVPETLKLPVLREAAMTCNGCDLYCNATQTVFGEGPEDAIAMFVGEQPGDSEDLAGHPFVGPAGKLLDSCLHEVGIDRTQCYVTNAVKHFKFEPRGKRRIHAKPSSREIAACVPWLQAETKIIKPKMIIALGATAAQAMMGPAFRITKSRGQVFTDTKWAPWFMATIHPSALLRMPDPAVREENQRLFVEDLTTVAKQLQRY